MPFSTAKIVTLAAAVSTASAHYRGFNYGNLKGSVPKTQTDFENEFTAAAGLAGTDGKFSSARLYTMRQGGTVDEPISAIPAAIKCKTSLLFGLWASAGDDDFNKEIQALKKTTHQYCSQLDGLVAGISVGSEDLYRETPTGRENNENPGTTPTKLVKYIRMTRDAVKGTCLEKAPIGHVDTWTAYANSTNEIIIPELDWLGVDEYPYYEFQKPNSIEKSPQLFQSAVGEVQNVIDRLGKKQEIWITEMGWPLQGKKTGQAEASKKNAEWYWKHVACPTFEKRNVWYFTLQDGDGVNKPDPSFGLVNDLKGKPLIDLSCSGKKDKAEEKSEKSEKDEQDEGSEKSGSKSGGENKAGSAGQGGEDEASSSSSSPSENEIDTGATSGSGSGKGSSDKGYGSGKGSSDNGYGGSKSGSGSGSGAGQDSGSSEPGYGSGSSGSGSSGSGSSGSGSSSSGSSGAGSSPNYGSKSGSGSSSGSNGSNNVGPVVNPPTTPYPTGGSVSNSSANANGNQGTGHPSPSLVAQAAGSQLNSLGAAAVALVLAVAVL
ncbi:hypothetical protein CP532_6347 [Ophiocordyceps camponoti-leonardi (nom. inval.)]|nr:hypothetical protein CP532_6347 [Ophiocordyceps camponoti-leonardi (nom. inval.)]